MLKQLKKVAQILIWLGLIALASGCVKSPHPSHPMDPYEDHNRKMFALNLAIDQGLLQPVATFYHFVVPAVLRSGVRHVFANIGEVNSLVNHLLQGDLKGGLINANRLVINTVFGIGGLFDVAKCIGLRTAPTSFENTLAVWGAKPKYYLVLPIFGSTTDRGIVGLFADYVPLSPYSYLKNRYLSLGLASGNFVQLREANLSTSEFIYESFDPYVFMRNAYLQSKGLDSSAPEGSAAAPNAPANEQNQHAADSNFDYVLE